MDRKASLEEDLEKVETKLKNKGGPEAILKLRKLRLQILLRLKRYDGVVNAGFLFIGSEGPDAFVFKIIVAAYCHERKHQEALDTLEKWIKNYKDETWKLREIRDGVLRWKALCSVRASNPNMDTEGISVEQLLGIREISMDDETLVEAVNWRYRSPPAQTVTYFICPRITDYVPCLFGDSCLAAHSKEELEEWKARAKGISPRRDSYSKVVVRGLTPTPPPTDLDLGQGHAQSSPIVAKFPTWLTGPPSNTPYLNQLIKNFADHILRNDFRLVVDDVKLTWSDPPRIRTILPEFTWILLIRSQRRDTLRTVSLLHDEQRINFRISEARFSEDETFAQSIDLIESNVCHHKNSAMLQVLSTFIPPKCLNRSCYFYKIGFAFRTVTPGTFGQTIILDFKENPKLIQELIVQVEATTHGNIQLKVPPQASSIPTSQNSSTLEGVASYSILTRLNKVKLGENSVLAYPMPLQISTAAVSPAHAIIGSEQVPFLRTNGISTVIQRPIKPPITIKPTTLQQQQSNKNHTLRSSYAVTTVVARQYSQRPRERRDLRPPLREVPVQASAPNQRPFGAEFHGDEPEHPEYPFLPDHHFIGNLIEEMINS